MSFLGKHCRLPFYPSLNITEAPFDIIHSDLWTSPVSSPSGFRYYLLFLDDFTHYLWIFPLKTKDIVYSLFVQFHAYVKTQFNKNIKTLQCDNGAEYVNSPLSQFCSSHGIVFRFFLS